MIIKIRSVLKKLLNWKLYFGDNKIEYIGNNVTLPNYIRISGGVTLSYKTMLASGHELFSWLQTRGLP